MMKITRIYIQFLETERGLLKEEKKLMEEMIKKHAEKAGFILNIPIVNITIYPNPDFTIPETGEGGYAPSKDWFHLYIDTTKRKEDLEQIIKNIIPVTIYHEMNHVSRWQHTGYGSSLLDVVITEGLANVFAEDQWKEFKAPWTNFSEKEMRDLLNLVKKREKNDDKNYNHGEWFYGTGKLPRWIGYKVGSYIIQSFRKSNKNIKWEEMSKMSAREIIEKSGINLE